MRDVQDWITAKRLFKRGEKIKQIAKQLKISKNTVKSLLKHETEPKYEKSIYPSIIDPFKEQVRVWFLSPEYNFIGTRIFKELLKVGYKDSIGPVYSFLKTLNGEKSEISKKAAEGSPLRTEDWRLPDTFIMKWAALKSRYSRTSINRTRTRRSLQIQ